jgi:hypothetical protein
MALTLPCDTDVTVSLEGYVDLLKTEVDFDDRASVLASAPRLRALANNRRFLVDRFNVLLARYLGTSAPPAYAPHSFTLASHPRFYVRANVWTRPAGAPRGRSAEESLFSYERAHDHNFSFMTVGYSGPGYETSIYEYDFGSVSGYPGEPVALEFLETTTLPQGKIMFYRQSRDVHIQRPPPSLSISLNLMLIDPAALLRDQFAFDLRRGTISAYVTTLATKRVSLLALARHIGDGSTVDILESLAVNHPCRRTRLGATEACAALRPGHREAFWRRAASDPEFLVRRTARAALDARRE